MHPPHDNRLLRAARVILMAWVVLLVLALDPFTADPAGPLKLLISAIAAAVLAALFLIAVLRGHRIRAGGMWWLPVLFLVWHALSAGWSSQPLHAVPALLPWTVYFVIAFVAAQVVCDAAQAWRLLAVAVAAMGCASLYGFVQAAGYDPFPWSARDIEEYRGLPATYANPNFAGHALVLALPLSLGLAWRAARMARFFWIALALILASHLYLTHMRGGPVALAAALVFLLATAYFARRGMPPARAGARLLGTAIALAAVLIPVALAAAHLRPGAPLPLDGSLVLRLNGYHGAARMALDHPVTGVGAGRFAVEAPAYWTPYETRWFAGTGKWNHHAHNELLETAAETGLPGAAFYIALLVAALLASLRAATARNRNQRTLAWVLAVCFAAFAADGLFGFNLRVPVSGAIFFLLWGIAARPRARTRTTRTWPAWAACAAAGVCLLISVNGYRGERAYQWGAGGREYLLAQLQEGEDADKFAATFAALDTGLAGAAKRLPWDARPDTLRAQLRLLADQPLNAEQAFAAALRRAPHDPGLRSRRALAAVRHAEETSGADAWVILNRAEFNALRALDICPELSEAERALGQIAALRAQDGSAPEGHRRVAIRRFEAALQQGASARASVQRALAQLYREEGDAVTAARYLHQAAENTPEDPRIWNAFQEFAAATGDWRSYADAMHHALGRDALPLANMLDLSMRLGQVYTTALPQTDLACAILGKALKRAPYRIDLWAVPVAGAAKDWRGALGALAAQSGPRTEAWPETVTYLLDAGNETEGEVLLRLGRLYLTAGAWTRADAALGAALKQLPADRRAPALRLHSEALAKLGKRAAALALAQEAFQREPNNVLTTLNLARRLAEADKLASADFQYASLREQVSPDADLFVDIAAEHAALQARMAEKDAAED